MSDTRKIIITRQLSDVGEFSRRFPAASFSVTEWPIVSIRSAVQAFESRRLLGGLDKFDAVIFTSPTAAVNTFACMQETGLELELLQRAKVYALGPATERLLLGRGIASIVIPTKHVPAAQFSATNGLTEAVECIRASMRDACTLLIPATDKVSRLLADALTKSGCQVASPTLHRGIAAGRPALHAYELLMSGQASCLAFTSPSSVIVLQKMFDRQQLENLTRDVELASLDAAVTHVLRSAGLRVDIQPARATLGELATAIMDFYG